LGLAEGEGVGHEVFSTPMDMRRETARRESLAWRVVRTR
jgi:hypothetical protein